MNNSKSKLPVLKFNPINGWNKAKIIEHIKTNFKGKSFRETKHTELSVSNEMCLYRCDDGRKCAVGLFIPDDKYHPGMEARGAIDLLVGEIEYKTNKVKWPSQFDFLRSLMPLNPEGMCAFQSVHDSSDASVTIDKMMEFIELRIEDSI